MADRIFEIIPVEHGHPIPEGYEADRPTPMESLSPFGAWRLALLRLEKRFRERRRSGERRGDHG